MLGHLLGEDQTVVDISVLNGHIREGELFQIAEADPVNEFRCAHPYPAVVDGAVFPVENMAFDAVMARFQGQIQIEPFVSGCLEDLIAILSGQRPVGSVL